jgi:hypothetical protein
VSLDDFVSERTPSGLTGRFAGTYAPLRMCISAGSSWNKQVFVSRPGRHLQDRESLSDALFELGRTRTR